MDEYQDSIFFEAKELTDREKQKIQRHFQKRQHGGGDCGMIEKAGDNTYKICFKEKEDQERVLQRKFHIISLPSEELHLTVSQTKLPQTSKPTDQPSTSHSQTFKKQNTKGLEKIFKIDIFLLYYLRDNPKAFKVLEKQLFAIGCKVELNFDEEEAVVRWDIERGPGRAFGSAEKRWELQVDKVFISLTESYLCYHVVEPKEVKILLQDLNFVTDDIKVYKEGGYAVVVGEVQAVKERIVILEKRRLTRKELPVVEKQFKLVEEEFSQEMCALCPEVKILRGNVNFIILKGPDKEVQLGVTKLEELIKKIKEKRVKISTALMTFMTSSDVISKYQRRLQHSLRNPVALEVGSDLVLSSLSSDALAVAEAAVLRDLIDVTVQLQGSTAVPPDLDQLKEILIKAKNQANLRELRVVVSLIPGPSGAVMTKVQLVGYSENVNKLKEALQDHQMNQIERLQNVHQRCTNEVQKRNISFIKSGGAEEEGEEGEATTEVDEGKAEEKKTERERQEGEATIEVNRKVTTKVEEGAKSKIGEEVSGGPGGLFGFFTGIRAAIVGAIGATAATGIAGAAVAALGVAVVERNERLQNVHLQCTYEAQKRNISDKNGQAGRAVPRRIVLLGKTGSGKSSLANTIFGEDMFKISHAAISETSRSHAVTKCVYGKNITLIDTCSFFDTCKSEKLLNTEIVRCITECAPGPHAFLIVLKVEKYTEQEKEVIKKIQQHFSEEAFKYAAVVCTHGDQLPEEITIEEFVNQSEDLSDLVCGGRCHVIDNKYWKDNEEHNHRSNQFQVAELLKTIDKISKVNNGRCYTNEMLKDVKTEIQREEEHIRQSSGNITQEEIGNKAKINVSNRMLIKFTGITTGALVGTLLGVAGMVTSNLFNFQKLSDISELATTAQGRATALSGAVNGACIGRDAAEGAKTPLEAVQEAAVAVWKQSAK